MRRFPHPGRRSIVLRLATFALTALLLAASAGATEQQALSTSTDRPVAVRVSPIDQFISEASTRFGIPERWIRAVMQAESAGDPRATSRAGAMGLMQIMPETWAELRAAHGFGDDPFDPRENILAGTAYLREMYDRFGSPGFLAAYNAGPERYARHLATGRPLPRETRAYIQSLAPLIGGSPTPALQDEGPVLTVDWRAAPLFVARLDQRSGSTPSTADPATNRPPDRAPSADAPHPNDPSDGLFVRPRAEKSE